MAPAAAGEVHAVTRRIVPHPREAAPDPDGLRGSLRCRRDAHSAEGSGHRRLGRVRERWHEGARADGWARERPVPTACHRCERRCGTHQQPGVRRLPRLRCEPGAVRDGGGHGPPRRTGWHQRVGDPQAQRHPSRRDLGPRPAHGRRLPRRGGMPRHHPPCLRRSGCGGQGGRSRSRPEELWARQRVQGVDRGHGALQLL